MAMFDHHHEALSMNRAFAIGFILNLGFVFVEAFYGWKVGSLALLADAGHNLSDVVGLALGWSAMYIGKLQPNTRHTYGWLRGSIMASFINAVILLLAMGFLIWESLHRLGEPYLMNGNTVMAVAGIGIVINTATALLFLRHSSRDINIRAVFLHMAADAAVSAGVVIAGGLYLVFGWSWLDPVVSLLIALVIIMNTFPLLTKSLHLMFDGVPEEIDLPAVRSYLESLPGVEGVHDLHIWAMSASQIAMTVHLVMPKGSPGDAFLNDIIETVHDRFNILHPTIQIEQGMPCHLAPAHIV